MSQSKLVNMNHETGIRFGVIHFESVDQQWCERSQQVFSSCCPFCKSTNLSGDDNGKLTCGDCFGLYDEDQLEDSDEALGEYFNDHYDMTREHGSPYIMVTKSPFYTFTRLCSQCFPNAGNLDEFYSDSVLNGFKTYCLGHEWFNDGTAIYPVMSVETDKLVYPGHWTPPNIQVVRRRFIDIGG